MTVSESTSAIDVVTVGESMVLFQPLREGPLAHAALFTRAMAGAESNLAIALARLGRRTRWISRLGADPFGDMALRELAGEGVDVTRVARDPSAPTAVFFREMKTAGDPSVFYYRAGSAASRLSPDDIRDDWLDGCRLLHVTGITPALGDGPRETILALMRSARACGVAVSFDPNLRRKLWDKATARRVLLTMLSLCDLFLPGREEAEFLIGEERPGESPGERCRRFLEMGPKVIVMKLGTEGAVARAGDVEACSPARPVARVVDPIGAGDAFDAGFLSVLLESSLSLSSPSEAVLSSALDRANRMGALATQFFGDWEGLPTLAEIRRMEAGERAVDR